MLGLPLEWVPARARIASSGRGSDLAAPFWTTVGPVTSRQGKNRDKSWYGQIVSLEVTHFVNVLTVDGKGVIRAMLWIGVIVAW